MDKSDYTPLGIYSFKLNYLKTICTCPNCPTTCFVQDFGPGYAKALSYNIDIMICGDLNCNMLSTDNPETRALSSFCTSINLTQLVSNPTRVTHTSLSLFDVILVTNPRTVESSEVLQSTISDHYIVVETGKSKIGHNNNT